VRLIVGEFYHEVECLVVFRRRSPITRLVGWSKQRIGPILVDAYLEGDLIHNQLQVAKSWDVIGRVELRPVFVREILPVGLTGLTPSFSDGDIVVLGSIYFEN
jgi:hypothetical protein